MQVLCEPIFIGNRFRHKSHSIRYRLREKRAPTCVCVCKCGYHSIRKKSIRAMSHARARYPMKCLRMPSSIDRINNQISPSVSCVNVYLFISTLFHSISFNSIKMPLFVIQFLECCHTTRASRGKWRQQKNRLRNANTQDIVYKIYDNGIRSDITCFISKYYEINCRQAQRDRRMASTHTQT